MVDNMIVIHTTIPSTRIIVLRSTCATNNRRRRYVEQRAGAMDSKWRWFYSWSVSVYLTDHTLRWWWYLTVYFVSMLYVCVFVFLCVYMRICLYVSVHNMTSHFYARLQMYVCSTTPLSTHTLSHTISYHSPFLLLLR